LYNAIEKNHSYIVNLLLTQNQQRVLLTKAVKPYYSYSYYVNYNGMDINKGWKERTPLFVACEKGLLDVVNALIARRDAFQFHQKEAPNIEKKLNWLLPYTARVNQPDSSGSTPLYIACSRGYLGVVKSLLKRKDIQVNRANNLGHTPVYTACQNGHFDVVAVLMKREEIQLYPHCLLRATMPFRCCQCIVGMGNLMEKRRQIYKRRNLDYNLYINSQIVIYDAVKEFNQILEQETMKLAMGRELSNGDKYCKILTFEQQQEQEMKWAYEKQDDYENEKITGGVCTTCNRQEMLHKYNKYFFNF